MRVNTAKKGSDADEAAPPPCARLVMRSRGAHRLLLNAALWPGMKATRMDGGRGASFAAVNGAAAAAGDALPPSSAVPAAAMATYAFRAPTPAALDEFVAAIEAHKGGEAE